MKLPSLLRLPKNRQFSYRPRYYDPLRDESAARESELNGPGRSDITRYIRGSITEAYKRRTGMDRKTDIRQVIFILSFTILGFGYIYIGNYVFYFLLVLVPLYIWAKFRKW